MDGLRFTGFFFLIGVLYWGTITIAKAWKQPKYSAADEWIKMCYIYMMEYYPVIKRRFIGFW